MVRDKVRYAGKAISALADDKDKDFSELSVKEAFPKHVGNCATNGPSHGLGGFFRAKMGSNKARLVLHANGDTAAQDFWNPTLKGNEFADDGKLLNALRVQQGSTDRTRLHRFFNKAARKI